MLIDLTGRVAIVTGAGHGLGRAHAIALSRHGARVLVNDLTLSDAEMVCQEIVDAGGEALPVAANVANCEHVQKMVDAAITRWGRVDILVNNAGVLRDKTFAKMELDDFRLVCEIHLMGSVHCTKAVWQHMQQQGYGRVIFTTSSSGLYGNFGQANYGAAKMALVGLMQTLALEGARNGIKVNCLAPSAATAMTNGLYSEQVLQDISPDLVSPAVVALASSEAPTRTILLAGGGSVEAAHITMTRGVCYGERDISAERIINDLPQVCDRTGEMTPACGEAQYKYEVGRRAALRPVCHLA